MMLLPAALAIINQIIQTEDKKFQTGLLLGIAFASSIGGSATLVGTMPNLILKQLCKRTNIDYTGHQFCKLDGRWTAYLNYFLFHHLLPHFKKDLSQMK